MEVKIGVQHAPRELVVETDISPDDFEAQLKEAVSSEGKAELQIDAAA